MKGDTEFVTTPLGIILFVGVILSLVVFVQASMLNLSAQMKVSAEQIQAVDAAHIAKYCFGKNLDGSIPISYLDSNKGKSLCTLCSICSVTAGAKVEILEGPSKGVTYDFDYSAKGSLHNIFVVVSTGSSNYVARLSMSVSEKASVTYYP